MHIQDPYVRTENDKTLQLAHWEPAAGTYARSTAAEMPHATVLQRPGVQPYRIRGAGSGEDHTPERQTRRPSFGESRRRRLV